MATLKRFLPADPKFFPIAEKARVRDIVKQMGIAEDEVMMVVIDGVLANLDSIPAGGQRLSLFPPLDGG